MDLGNFFQRLRFHKQSPQIDVPRATTNFRFTLVAPDLLRADSPENIYLQAEGIISPIDVAITVADFTKTTTLFTDGVTLDQSNSFHTLKSVQVKARFRLGGPEMRSKSECECSL
ncbi:complement C3-like [Phycodurus eques]|uniref:complement C3-like n=1 Tax=Phycodurus eques TaxID=693459 RepID=UPI002ACDE638|nr:complement C3-like [Phycodurus eques]